MDRELNAMACAVENEMREVRLPHPCPEFKARHGSYFETNYCECGWEKCSHDDDEHDG